MEGIKVININKTTGQYLIRLDCGIEVVSALSHIAQKHKIPSGSITALGAVKDATLGWFHPDTKQYTKEVFPEPLELVGLTGNIAYMDNQPAIHIHAVLGGTKGKTYAGHLFSATVAVLVEVTILGGDVSIQRKKDTTFGLNFLDI